MNMGFVLYHHRTQGRGVEAVHIHGLCGGMRELGADVSIIGPPGVITDPDVVVSSETGETGTIWGRVARAAPQALFECMEIGYNLAALPRLLARIRTRKPDLIYERYSLFNAAGVVAGRLTRIPVILEINDTAQSDRTRQGKGLKMRGLARAFERWIFRRAHSAAVVSGFLRDELAARGFPASRIVVTPNAVDAGRFDPERVSGDAIRERYGLHGKVVIGFVGSFTKWHGADFLVRSCARLMADFPELRLLLVGDGVTRTATEELANELGVADRTAFAGKVPHADVPMHMAAMDVGVMPASNTFGSPVKVFEYMAMGIPAVGPRYVPLEEAIREGVCGLIFEPDNAESLEGCLRALIADPVLRHAMGDAARRKVLEHHLWVHNARQVWHLLQLEQR